MRLQLVAHVVLELPDDLLAGLREARVPGLVTEALRGLLASPARVTVPVPVAGGSCPLPLRLGMVEWRADHVRRTLQEVRGAALTTQSLREEGDSHGSVLDRRRRSG